MCLNSPPDCKVCAIKRALATLLHLSGDAQIAQSQVKKKKYGAPSVRPSQKDSDHVSRCLQGCVVDRRSLKSPSRLREFECVVRASREPNNLLIVVDDVEGCSRRTDREASVEKIERVLRVEVEGLWDL